MSNEVSNTRLYLGNLPPNGPSLSLSTVPLLLNCTRLSSGPHLLTRAPLHYSYQGRY